MNDKELCEIFDTALEEVEADVKKYENSDSSEMNFGASIEGKTINKVGNNYGR